MVWAKALFSVVPLEFLFFLDRGTTCFFGCWPQSVLLAIGPISFVRLLGPIIIKGQPGPNINYSISFPLRQLKRNREKLKNTNTRAP